MLHRGVVRAVNGGIMSHRYVGLVEALDCKVRQDVSTSAGALRQRTWERCQRGFGCR